MASPTKQPPPKLGTSEFDKFIEDQAQTAMDHASSMPLVRIVSALGLVLCGFGLLVTIMGPLLDGTWSGLMLSLWCFLLLGVPFLLGIGYAVGRRK